MTSINWNEIEAVIFDWAGTTVDYGCFAPVKAFMEVFEEYGISPTLEETRKPMGMLKIDHIRTMLSMPRINALWQEKYGRDYKEKDVHAMYDIFESKLLGILDQYAEVKPYVLETVKELRKRGIKIGSTTGYTNIMMDIVTRVAKANGYEPDCWVSPDATGSMGRPYPYMIYHNMEALKVSSVHKVVKIGDTVSDMEEGVHAGVITIGVIEGSSEMGMTEAEYKALPEEARARACDRVYRIYKDAGANYVIMNLAELLK